MPPKPGRGRGKRCRTPKKEAKKTKVDEEPQLPPTDSSPSRTENAPESPKTVHVEPREDSPSRSPRRESLDDDEESVPLSDLAGNTDVARPGDKEGKDTTIPPPVIEYSFIEAQEEEIARWLETKKMLYDMKDKQYKDKTLRRKLWEEKASEYGVNYDSIQKWYHTQRTRFSKLRDGQPMKKSQKRSDDGLSSGEDEDPIHAEASEEDSDRDRFIRRVFWFLKPHIRRHKKDTPASFKDKLALAETGELAGSDDSTMTGSLVDEPRQPTKKYTGYPTPSVTSKTRKAANDHPDSPVMGSRGTGASRDLQDRLVQFITREQPDSRATPFCKYLETELNRIHDACLEPAYDEITTVLNHYRKMSRKFKMREAAGEQISPLEEIPSAFQSQQPQQQRPVAMIPVCTSATYPRISQLQQESGLSGGTYYPTSRSASPSVEFQPGPNQWPRNPPPSSVWRSQEPGYVEQATQQFNLEQQQQQTQFVTLQPTSTTTQGYIPSHSQTAFVQQPPAQE